LKNSHIILVSSLAADPGWGWWQTCSRLASQRWWETCPATTLRCRSGGELRHPLGPETPDRGQGRRKRIEKRPATSVLTSSPLLRRLRRARWTSGKGKMETYSGCCLKLIHLFLSVCYLNQFVSAPNWSY